MISKIPGPPTLPIIGNIHLFFGADIKGLINIQDKLFKTYGTILRVWIGPHLWINLAEPKYIHALLSSEHGTNKDSSSQFYKSQSDGIFIASGKKWKTLRKIINPTFHQKILETYLITFNEKSDILVKQLDKKVDEPIFDIGDYTAKCTLDFLCGTLMGVKSGVQYEKHNNFSKNVTESIKIIQQRFYKLHYQPEWVFRFSKISKQLIALVEPALDFAKQVILERVKIREEEDSDYQVHDRKGRSIYLDTVLDNFKHMSLDELTTLTLDTFIAATDTTRVATAYTFLLLGAHPDIQERVYQEIIEVVGDGEFTIYNLTALMYLDMVLKEVLRLFSVPMVTRELGRDLDVDDLTLPSGSCILVSFNALHHDPKFWKHPDEFHPDHFLPEEVSKRPKYSYLPFGYGPRNCPGHAFAMLSMKTMIGSVIRKYRILSKFDMQNAEYEYIFMQELKNGYPVQLMKRI
uniref:Cytochrome P450 CYP417A3 n=1 Tax=Nilaparvata lugens TaxID=108931 RepID=A0A0K0LBC9_NILLU|nr:cytochrome P450 CYP417A3 [Nilaparvata lugens]